MAVQRPAGAGGSRQTGCGQRGRHSRRRQRQTRRWPTGRSREDRRGSLRGLSAPRWRSARSQRLRTTLRPPPGRACVRACVWVVGRGWLALHCSPTGIISRQETTKQADKQAKQPATNQQANLKECRWVGLRHPRDAVDGVACDVGAGRHGVGDGDRPGGGQRCLVDHKDAPVGRKAHCGGGRRLNAVHRHQGVRVKANHQR